MTSSRNSVFSRIVKGLLLAVGALLGLVLFVLVSVTVISRLPAASRKAGEVASGFVNGEVGLEHMSLSLFSTFPNARIVLEGLAVVTEEGDTLASLDELKAKANYLSLIGRGPIKVPLVSLEGLEVDARCRRDGSANWNIFPESDEPDTTAPKPLVLPDIVLDELSIGAPSLKFTSPNLKFDVNMYMRASASNRGGEGVKAKLSEFFIRTGGLEADVTGGADDILGEDPHFNVDGNLKADLASLSRFLPSWLKVEGAMVCDVAVDASLSEFALEKLPDADIRASLVADNLKLDDSRDSLFAFVGDPHIDVRPLTGEKGIGLDFATQKIFVRTGQTRVIAESMDLSASAGSQPVQDSLHRRMSRSPRKPRGERELPDFLSEPDFRLSDLDFHLDESLSDLLVTLNPTAEADIRQALLVTPAFPLRNKLERAHLKLDQDVLSIDTLQLQSGTSDLEMCGTLSGLRMLQTGRGALMLKMDVNSHRINVNELMAALGAGSDSTAAVLPDSLDAEAYVESVAIDSLADVGLQQGVINSLIVVPANLIADINVTADEVKYSTIEVNDFRTNLLMRERCLQINRMRASSDFVKLQMDAFYSTCTKQNIAAGVGLELHDITAERVIDLIPAVDDVLPMLKSFKGNLNVELAATSQLDTNMNFILPSVQGIFKIGGNDLLVEDLGKFRRLARLLLFRNNKEGLIRDMSVNGLIIDNRIEVFPFLLGVDRYTVALKGTQDFDESFKYHISLINSPILLKLGLNVFGPSFDKLKWRLGRAQFRSTRIPMLYDDVEDMQVNLVTSIQNIFQRGIEATMADNRSRLDELDMKKRIVVPEQELEDLTEEEQEQFDILSMEMDVDEEAEDLSAEIDKILQQDDLLGQYLKLQ